MIGLPCYQRETVQLKADLASALLVLLKLKVVPFLNLGSLFCKMSNRKLGLLIDDFCLILEGY